MKKLKFYIFILCLLSGAMLTATKAFCQSGGVSISPGGGVPDPSAALDISYSNKGFLMPRLTKGERDSISSPALGLEIYNTTDNCIEVYGFGNWQSLNCLCTAPPSTPSNISGSNNVCASATGIAYSVTPVAGASAYSWTVPSGATVTAGQGTNSVLVNFGANSGYVSVAANNSCGSSSLDTFSVYVNSTPPTPGTISGMDSACPNVVGYTYSIGAVSRATSYNWTVPSGASITANTGISITVTFGPSPAGAIAVSATNVCGTSAQDTFRVYKPTNNCPPDTFFTNGSINTGSIQYFTVPNGVTSLTINALGAQGGSGNGGYGSTAEGCNCSLPGGLGAQITGTFAVNSGDVIAVLVGQAGGGYGGPYGSENGGGGGSFVVDQTSNTLLIVAGGGGGGPSTTQGTGCTRLASDGSGQAGTSGVTPSCPQCGCSGAGGTNGDGGSAGTNGGNFEGGAGGGYYTNGGNGGTQGGCSRNQGAQGGMSYLNGGTGGLGGNCYDPTGINNAGGYGGGGGGIIGGPGGGGGYSGGGSLGNWNSYTTWGGGGGSYNAGTSQTSTSGVQTGNGMVIFTW